MCSKNNQPSSQSVGGQRPPRSLRLRLALWYGTLLAVALSCFVVLIWKLTGDALTQSVDNALRTEVRVVGLALNRTLRTTPPYWPAQPLNVQLINPYQDAGITISMFDTGGKLRYASDGNSATRLPLDDEVGRATRAGQTVWSTVDVGGERVRVEAVPLYAPPPEQDAAQGTVTGPIIGTLLLARSLEDVDSTLLLLRTLLFSVGLATLIGALLGGWAIAGRALYPLAEIVRTARAIGATTAQGTRIGNLSRRVQTRRRGRDEMAQVVDTLNEMLANLEKATQTQRRFIADASHELRAPLTTIQGNLSFLMRHMDELPREERQQMLSDAHQETLRLAQLVDELLMLARADARLSSSSKAEELGRDQQPLIELDRVVLQLVRQFRGRLHLEKSAPALEVGHIEPVHVRGEEEDIRRILLILLDNAVKYTPASEKNTAGRVVVLLEVVGNEAVLRVRDTGIGIDPEDLPQIFERFYRADRARSRVGTGLGLAIARMLVERLDGRITAESVPGQGSTFSVWLPCA